MGIRKRVVCREIKRLWFCKGESSDGCGAVVLEELGLAVFVR